MGGYIFEGKVGKTAPRLDEYTFYIAGKDNSGNYSEISSVTVQHPGIQQLQLASQDVKGLLSSIKINLPKVFSERSQTVYPSEAVPEEKGILGYRLHIQEIDYDTLVPIGDEEIADYDVENLGENRTVYYQNETGKKFEIKVGAYDSVYHPNYNPSLYQSTISTAVTAETFKVREPDIPDNLIEPSKLTETLRTTINDAHSYATTINPGDITDNTQAINNNIAKFYNDAIAELSADALTGDTTISVSGLSTDIESGATLAIAAADISSSAYAIVETTTETLSGATSIDITSLPTDLNTGSKIKLGDAYSASSIKQNSEEITLTVENLNDDTNLTNHQYSAISATYNEISLQVGNVETDLNKTGNNNPYDGINHNYGQIEINSDRITNTVSQISTENAIAILNSTASSGDTILYFESGIDVQVDKFAKVYLSDSDETNNYYAILEVQSDTPAGSTSMDVEAVPTGVEFSAGTGVKIASEYFATQVNQLSDEYTVKIDGYTPAGDPITGGFGISVEGDENKWVDFNVVADKFRIFDTDGTKETSLFSIDTTDGIIFLDANQITMRASNTTWDVFFDLDSDGLSINTPGLKLDKAGNAIFDGEVSSEQFSLTSGDLVINSDGINANITSEFTLNAVDGSAEFAGKLQAAYGTFDGFIRVDQGAEGVFKTSTIVVAASNSSNAGKQGADYVCNGYSDESDINLAINALSTAGGAVKLLEGTFIVDSSITIPDNVELYGQGKATIIKLADNTDTDGLNVIENNNITNGNKNIVIKDLKILGNKNNNANLQNGVYFENSEDIQISKLKIENFSLHGIEFDTTIDSTIDSCITVSCVEGINLSYSDNNNIVSCVSKEHSAMGMSISYDSNGNTISGNIIKNNARVGLYSSTCFNNRINNNNLEKNGEHGMSVNNLNDCNITSNYCIANSQAADDSYDNIHLRTDSNDNNIQGNTCRKGSETNQPRYGINVSDSDCWNNFVTNNDLKNSGKTNQLNDNGTDTRTTAGNRY